MKIQQFIVDAFATKVFQGNPAAVCPLDQWLTDGLMQQIAAENNLSETAFFVKTPRGFDLRWFTPTCEVDLCGHATLASAHVLFNHLNFSEPTIHFFTKSGELKVTKRYDRLEMIFPASMPKPCVTPAPLQKAFGAAIRECLAAEDYLLVLESEEAVYAAHPDVSLLKQVDLRGVIVTAAGTSSDFVSRFFAPNVGIYEDPVTGSAHCQSTPYWSQKLNKSKLHAIQVSKRRGELFCQNLGDKVSIAGTAITFMQGTIEVP